MLENATPTAKSVRMANQMHVTMMNQPTVVLIPLQMQEQESCCGHEHLALEQRLHSRASEHSSSVYVHSHSHHVLGSCVRGCEGMQHHVAGPVEPEPAVAEHECYPARFGQAASC